MLFFTNKYIFHLTFVDFLSCFLIIFHLALFADKYVAVDNADDGNNCGCNFKVISKCDRHKKIQTLRLLCRIDDNFYLTLLFTLLMLMMAATVGEISSDLYRHQNGLSK